MRPVRRGRTDVVEGARKLGARMGCGRGAVQRAAEQMCYLLASRTGVPDERGGAVEKAPDNTVYSIGACVWGGCR
jgi:hypothetical protein